MTLASTNGNGATAQEILERSVSKRDYNDRPYPGVFSFMLPAPLSANVDLPAFWTPARDWMLYSTFFRESMWQAAINIAVSKIAAQGFDVDSDVPLRAKRAQQMFLNMDAGKGFVSGISKHLQAYILTCNGGPIEIVRASSAAGSKILGLVPLDTFRTWRTGDPAIPVIYQDLRGGWHELKDYEVILLSDMPDQSDRWYGIGHPAAERAYKTILKLEAIERYIFEKVSGQRALSIYFVNGVMAGQVEQAVESAKATAQAKGVVTYLGATIIPLAGDIPVQIGEVPLAELPDGFNRKEEWDITLNTYARSLGIAVQDLQPLSGQGLGTGAQSQVLDEAAKGQGLAAWRQAFEHAVNEYALDDQTTFYFKTDDIRDREREAKVSLDFATTMQAWFTMGMPYAQLVNFAVDNDQLPPEYRVDEQDLTPGEIISDNEKPGQMDADGNPIQPKPTPQQAANGQTQQPPVPPPPATLNAKEWREWTQAVAETLERAQAMQQAEKEARQLESDAALAEAVKGLAEALKTPTQLPLPIVHTDPALVAAVQALQLNAYKQTDKEAPDDDGQRVIEVIEQFPDGTPKKWLDSPA